MNQIEEMTGLEEYHFLADMVIIILIANFGGFIANKLNQPAVLGQIVGGLVAGPTFLGLVQDSAFITEMSEIGVILLMFIAGLETDVDELKSSGKASTMIALGGVVVPFLMGGAALYLLRPGLDNLQYIYYGIILTATSVSITVQTLRDMNCLRCRAGVSILGAAIIDDVIGIVLVTVVTGLVSPSGSSNLFMVIMKIVGFFLIAIGIGVVFYKLLNKRAEIFNRQRRLLQVALIYCFVSAIFAEEMGVAAIIGAYFTGVVFSTTHYRNQVSHEVQRVAYALFTPIFFVHIGIAVKMPPFTMGLAVLSIALTAVALLGKVIGAGLGAKISKFSNEEAMQIGLGMMPRAEVALIVANLGLSMKIINQELFTTVIVMVIMSTIVTPIFLKGAFKAKKAGKLKGAA
jgi:Kef-type K+ transport system membrane component KefB